MKYNLDLKTCIRVYHKFNVFFPIFPQFQCPFDLVGRFPFPVIDYDITVIGQALPANQWQSKYA